MPPSSKKLDKTSEKIVILLEDINSCQVESGSVVGAAATDPVISLFPLDAHEEKVVKEGGRETPLGCPERPVENGDVCDAEAVTEVDVEDEDVDVVVGVADIGASGTNPSVSRSQRSFTGKDLQKSLCPRVLLTPLIFHNKSLKSSTIFINLPIRNSLLASY